MLMPHKNTIHTHLLSEIVKLAQHAYRHADFSEHLRLGVGEVHIDSVHQRLQAARVNEVGLVALRRLAGGLHQRQQTTRNLNVGKPARLLQKSHQQLLR